MLERPPDVLRVSLVRFFDNTRLERRQNREAGGLAAAAVAFEALADALEIAGAASLHDLGPAHGRGGGAGRALDTQRRAEADEIGGGADVLVGHSPALAR